MRFIPALLILLNTAVFAQMPGAKKGFIKAGLLNVYYEQTGDGSPLFLLHAGLQDNRMWDVQVSSLSKKYQVITLDLPAHGKTQGSDTITQMADILRIVMDSLHLPKASFAGLSFGGVCVMDIVLTYPERVTKAIFVAPGLMGMDKVITMDSVSGPLEAKLENAFKGNDTIRQAELFTQVWGDGPFRSAKQINPKVREYIYETTLKNLRIHADDYWPRFINRDAALKVNAIQIPVLIINAEKDLP